MLCCGPCSCDSDWADLTHVFLDPSAKAMVKEQLGMTQVPFYIIIAKVREVDDFGVDFLGHRRVRSTR
jgi:hypothetical protein